MGWTLIDVCQREFDLEGSFGPFSEVQGDFTLFGENHGKPSYKKICQSKESLDAMIYFWDERDGSHLSGWWIGPKDRVLNCFAEFCLPRGWW